MVKNFDSLEIRSSDERAKDISIKLPELIKSAKENSIYYKSSLKEIDPNLIIDEKILSTLPVVRKSEMIFKDKTVLPLKKFIGRSFESIDQIFQSPGPIYEPGMHKKDWWRWGRALSAIGIGNGDIVQNCFSYHFTPAGMMFESAALAVGAIVVPTGTGQTELQAQAISNLGVTVYAGTPDYLKTILDKGNELGLDTSCLKKAAVSAGPLFPALREEYKDRGILCRQSYGTADLGLIAYESEAMVGMILDEGVIVEIVTPGTGIPVNEGEIGEVVVTTFNNDYPMIRFATGDLSAVKPGQSPCGRTNKLIVGWRGRADQAAKVKGMFVRPEQVAMLVSKHKNIYKARISINHDGSTDIMNIQLETESLDKNEFENSIKEIFKLRASIELVPPKSLPNDGKVIDDLREIN